MAGQMAQQMLNPQAQANTNQPQPSVAPPPVPQSAVYYVARNGQQTEGDSKIKGCRKFTTASFILV
jgi:hypothetical protein